MMAGLGIRLFDASIAVQPVSVVNHTTSMYGPFNPILAAVVSRVPVVTVAEWPLALIRVGLACRRWPRSSGDGGYRDTKSRRCR